MADNRPLYSTCVAILGFVCFVIGAAAVGLPVWGYFDNPPNCKYHVFNEPTFFLYVCMRYIDLGLP